MVWPSGGLARRRLVCRDVVHHLAQLHFGVEPESVLYIADQLDEVLANSKGEEGCLAVKEVSFQSYQITLINVIIKHTHLDKLFLYPHLLVLVLRKTNTIMNHDY